jgi:hypothetical protein
MSILTFLNTVYDTSQNRLRTGGPASLIPGSTYEYNTLRYPLDIGNYDKGHYMVIHINQQTKTQFSVVESGEDTTAVENTKRLIARRGNVNFGGVAVGAVGLASTAAGAVASTFPNATAAVSSAINNGLNSINSSGVSSFAGSSIKYVTEAGTAAISPLKNINAESFLRTVKRTTDSITLYMPDTLQFTYDQSYDELNLNSSLLAGGLLAAKSIVDSMGVSATSVGQTASPFLFSALGSVIDNKTGGNLGRAFAYQVNGMVRNPMLELIYSQPRLRTFRFDFAFYPRDEKEALEVQKILERLRFHQAPEVKSGMNGYFLIPPSEFDIKFYYMGKINPNLDPLTSCVLETIDINYAPSGFSAYESLNETSPSLGRTGMPTAIQLSLVFKETQIKTKDNYKNNSRTVGVPQLLASLPEEFEPLEEPLFGAVPFPVDLGP